MDQTLGAAEETALLKSVSTDRFDVVGPSRADLQRMAVLAAIYEDFPLGAIDASIVALAERIGDPLIATLDRRHFPVVRCEALVLRLVPDRIEPSSR